MLLSALLTRTFLVLAAVSLLAAQAPPNQIRPPRFLDPSAPSLAAALPPPPAPGSLEDRADLETVLQVQVWRTPEQAALAQRLVQDEPFKFAEVLGPRFSAIHLPRTAAFLEQVLADCYAVSTALKDRFQRKRPHEADPRVQPCLQRSSSPSYPSGHSTRAYVLATVLADLFPVRRDPLFNYARKAAWARVQGGVHYPTDLEGGRVLAAAIVATLHSSATFRAAESECRAEIAAWAAAAEPSGRKVHFDSRGEGEPALVLIHGWTCDGGFWNANLPALAARHRVLVLDLPGHGRSTPCDPCSMEELGDGVLAAMDAAGVRRAVLVGHSMGGAVMLAAVRRAPQRVQAIVAVDAVFADVATATRLQDRYRNFAGADGPKAREAMVRAMFTPATPKPIQEQILKGMLGTSEATAVGAMKAMFAPSFWREDRIEVPFLAIAAGTSTWITEAGLRTRFPKAQVKRMEGTGHFLMMEKPEAFNRILLEWVEGLGK